VLAPRDGNPSEKKIEILILPNKPGVGNSFFGSQAIFDTNLPVLRVKIKIEFMGFRL
jgi:hypothetical protein